MTRTVTQCGSLFRKRILCIWLFSFPIDHQESETALSGRFFYVRFLCIFPIICRKTAEYYSIPLAFIHVYIHFPLSCIPRLPQHYILYINYSLNYAFTNSCVISPFRTVPALLHPIPAFFHPDRKARQAPLSVLRSRTIRTPSVLRLAVLQPGARHPAHQIFTICKSNASRRRYIYIIFMGQYIYLWDNMLHSIKNRLRIVSKPVVVFFITL